MRFAGRRRLCGTAPRACSNSTSLRARRRPWPRRSPRPPPASRHGGGGGRHGHGRPEIRGGRQGHALLDRRRGEPRVPRGEGPSRRRIPGVLKRTVRNANTMIRKKLIAGNWKMNKTSADAVALARDIVFSLGTQSSVDVVVCPPFTALEGVARAVDGSLVKLGAQNMHFEASGAFTGEVSAPMLRALFATHVILGHSERRTLFGETDELVNKKVLSAQTERARDGVSKEIAASIIIAYEPVWAIGTGKVATTEQAQEVHGFIRGLLAKAYGDAVAQRIRILYGGSMKPANAPELLAQKDIDGGLIGGASLEVRSFIRSEERRGGKEGRSR